MKYRGIFLFVLLLFFPVLILAATPDRHSALLDLSDAFADIAERVNPSVVNITVTDKNGPLEQLSDEEDEEEEDGPGEGFDDQVGYGSGVIIDQEGYILTSSHVVDAAERIEVKLASKDKYLARLIGQDPETDLALIKVEPKSSLPAAPLGDSSKLRPGQWVMAIGNPFVYDHTVTVGVISALNRNLGTTIFDDFIQTDAAINFGNSGGPLLNLKGEVIGINTLISSQGTGIGFAIPINTAKQILNQLKEKGKVSRGYLGLVPQEITPELQKALDLSVDQGVIVSSVQSDTPADKSGLKRYDVILEVNDRKVESEDQFRRLVAETDPGTKVKLKVMRDNKTLTIEAELAERQMGALNVPPETEDSDRVGLNVVDLSDDLRERFRIQEEIRGVVVTHVKSGLAADVAGLRHGDVILEINKKEVTDSALFSKMIDEAKSGEIFVLYVYRAGNFLFLTLKIE